MTFWVRTCISLSRFYTWKEERRGSAKCIFRRKFLRSSSFDSGDRLLLWSDYSNEFLALLILRVSQVICCLSTSKEGARNVREDACDLIHPVLSLAYRRCLILARTNRVNILYSAISLPDTTMNHSADSVNSSPSDRRVSWKITPQNSPSNSKQSCPKLGIIILGYRMRTTLIISC